MLAIGGCSIGSMASSSRSFPSARPTAQSCSSASAWRPPRPGEHRACLSSACSTLPPRRPPAPRTREGEYLNEAVRGRRPAGPTPRHRAGSARVGHPRIPDQESPGRRRSQRDPAPEASVRFRHPRCGALVSLEASGSHRDHIEGGRQGIVGKVKPIVERARDASVEVTMGGRPVFLAELERYSERAQLLFPLAIVVVGLIHYEAFRTLQGLILPLVTALLAVIWGLGAMGLFKTPMDAFNVTTPILIFAVAAGHAVQILKRYYEEYHRLAQSGAMPASAVSRQAVVESLTRVGPVMLAAGIVAGLGFLSLVVFEVATIRTFGVFTALGIFSALVLELTFIPALRSLLPAPGPRESRRESERRIWDRFTETIAEGVLGTRRRRVYAVVT